MIKSIKAVPRVVVERILIINPAFSGNLCLISICCTGDKPLVKKNGNTLPLVFDDIQPENLAGLERCGYNNLVPFSEEQALEVIKFLLDIKELINPIDLIIHCLMGVSRSGSIATFAWDLLGKENGISWDQFRNDNPHISPNPHVSRVLNKVYREYVQKKL